MLSLAAIVKNEVQTIEQAIESVKGHVNEIVIGLDEASDDGTREKLAAMDDVKVIPIHLSEELAKKGPAGAGSEWGFSKARNDVLEACDPNSWRLIMDGHEVVKHADRMKKEVLKAEDDGHDAIEVYLNFEPDSNGIPRLVYRQARILAPHVKYVNPIHNAPVINNVFFTEAFALEHKKKEQAIESKKARDVQRSDSTINGLKKNVAASPNDPRARFYLGMSFKENGFWKEAIEQYKKYLTLSNWKEERWHARANMGICFRKFGYDESARRQFVLAIKEFPAMAEAYYYLADLAYRQKHFHEAEVWLNKCLEFGIPNCRLFVNPKIYLVDRYDLLSMVYHHLNQFGRAINCARKALEAAPNARIEDNIQKWKKKIKNHSGEYYDDIWKEYKPSLIELQRLKAMAAELKESATILDVGSGPGLVIQYLDGSKYTAVDGSAYARQQVEKKGGNAVSSLEELKDLKFDGCILGEFLEHLEDDEAFLKEIVKHLTDDAVIVASVPRYGAMYDPAHAREYTEKQFEGLMKTAGEIKKLDPIGPWMLCTCTANKRTAKPESVLEVI